MQALGWIQWLAKAIITNSVYIILNQACFDKYFYLVRLDLIWSTPTWLHVKSYKDQNQNVSVMKSWYIYFQHQYEHVVRVVTQSRNWLPLVVSILKHLVPRQHEIPQKFLALSQLLCKTNNPSIPGWVVSSWKIVVILHLQLDIPS